MTIEEQLEKEYVKRKRLYDKGLNDEKLNDKIRKIQKALRDTK